MGPATTVDLSADAGEADTVAGRRVEFDLLALVTTVHVACGGHAGDEGSMRTIIGAAGAAGVAVGAHPSYPDREGFGRRPMDLAPADLARSLRAQIGSCRAVADACGIALTSVKAHGALYAEVARGGPECGALLGVVRELCEPTTAIVLPPGAAALREVENAGFRVLEEGFCDRAYGPDGELVDRRLPGAVYEDPARAAEQALALAGRVDTLCVHGDSPGAPAMAAAVRRALTQAGIAVAAVVPQP